LLLFFPSSQALAVWVLKFTYDSDVLTYVSTTTSSFYTSAVVSTGSSAISMSTSGLKSGVSDASVTGDEISVVTLSFTVNDDVAATTHDNVLSFEVTQMVNAYSIAFASKATGQVNDARGGAETQAQLEVAKVAFVGLFAYAPLNELINTAPLTGSNVSVSLAAEAIYNWAGYGNSGVTSEVSCSLVNEGDASVVDVSSGCEVRVECCAPRGRD
jgi:hypothetical protein